MEQGNRRVDDKHEYPARQRVIYAEEPEQRMYT